MPHVATWFYRNNVVTFQNGVGKQLNTIITAFMDIWPTRLNYVYAFFLQLFKLCRIECFEETPIFSHKYPHGTHGPVRSLCTAYFLSADDLVPQQGKVFGRKHKDLFFADFVRLGTISVTFFISNVSLFFVILIGVAQPYRHNFKQTNYKYLRKLKQRYAVWICILLVIFLWC